MRIRITQDSTRKNLPTGAWYRSLSLPCLRSMDMWFPPNLSWLPMETLRYRSACNCPHPAAPAEADLPEWAHSRISHSVRSESARPSNAVWKIPSLLIYNSFLGVTDTFLLPAIPSWPAFASATSIPFRKPEFTSFTGGHIREGRFADIHRPRAALHHLDDGDVKLLGELPVSFIMSRVPP